jgi:uncharacterized membrane protein
MLLVAATRPSHNQLCVTQASLSENRASRHAIPTGGPNMHASPLHYFPVTTPFIMALLLVIAVVIALVELHILAYAYEKMGVHRRYVFVVLLGSLLGSYVNIPVAELPQAQMIRERVIRFGFINYVVPVVEEWPRTIIAVNLGGAVIPTLLALYLVAKNELWLAGAVGVALETIAVHLMAYPIKGVGIAVPTLVPPVIAALIGWLLSRRAAPALAYVSGVLGTLIGADLLNLDRIRGLEAPVVSIGGAGTFDGIFLTGILAVLLTAASRRRPRTASDEASIHG